jgi:hypothetical protein
MVQKFTARQRQRIFFVLIPLMLSSRMTSAELVVHPDGSATITNGPMSEVDVGDTQSSIVLAVGQDSITVDFNDLASEQVVSPDRYIDSNSRS